MRDVERTGQFEEVSREDVHQRDPVLLRTPQIKPYQPNRGLKYDLVLCD